MNNLSPLNSSAQLLQLPTGSLISKRELFDLIQYSKQVDSACWHGPDWAIGNTPQQGINWIGPLTAVQAVIIKTRPGSYDADGWAGDKYFRYSLKARNGAINRREKANAVLLQQPLYGYPILLLTEQQGGWVLEGHFSVRLEEEDAVLLQPMAQTQPVIFSPADDSALVFQEGQAIYQLHQTRERSQAAVALVKSLKEWRCEICSADMQARYGVPFIEAHHKMPLSQLDGTVETTADDFALLCPNCHTAVHACMALDGLDYDEICQQLVIHLRGERAS